MAAYEIAGEIFPTKTKVIERVKGIIADAPDNKPLCGADYKFMLCLLNRHPDALTKVGVGVEAIFVARNPVWPGERNRGFFVRRTDKTICDFSYRECITPSSKEKKVKAAFRAAIQHQAFAFKQSWFDVRKERLCPDTGRNLTFLSSHVDHVIPFDRVLRDFLDTEQVRLRDVGLAKHDNLAFEDTLEDEGLCERWIAYHEKHAVLEVVSKESNLSLRRTGAKRD